MEIQPPLISISSRYNDVFYSMEQKEEDQKLWEGILSGVNTDDNGCINEDDFCQFFDQYIENKI